MVMNPVPRLVKVAFHVFGVICFVETLVHIGYTTSLAATEDCVCICFIVHCLIPLKLYIWKYFNAALKYFEFLGHLSHSDDLLLGLASVMVQSPSSFVR